MEPVAFTERIRERDVLGARDGQILLNQARRRLQHRLADYLAEHLPQGGYQLLRVLFGEAHDSLHREIVLTLLLEVGQVTETPFINVTVAADPAAEVRANQAWHDLTGEVIGPLTLTAAFDKLNEVHDSKGLRKKTPANPPPRRHILIEKSPLNSEATA